MATIQTQTFGIEIEFFGMPRQKAARVVADYFGTEYRADGRGWKAKGRRERWWKIVRDGSIHSTLGEGCELVSPILNYSDIEDVQNIIRALREKGMKVNKSCGIHIHVGADQHDAKSLRNLINIFSSKQDMIYRSLDILANRESHYAKKLDENFIRKVNTEKPVNLIKMGEIWYGGSIQANMQHYNNTRYHGLNLHNVWYGQTVEFRLFNSTTHAGKVKAYIQFCLAISTQAINSRSVSPKQTVSDNEKYTFRTWLLRLGLIGDEFKTCRTHLLKNLVGNSAWRNGQAN